MQIWHIRDEREYDGRKSLWQRFHDSIGNIDPADVGDECVKCTIGKPDYPNFHLSENFIAFVKSGPCADFTSINISTVANMLSWEMTNGRIPDEHRIRRICANTGCVNPNHYCLKPVKKRKPRRDKSNDLPNFSSFLLPWIYNCKPFDRDAWIDLGYKYCVYEFYDLKTSMTYIGRTDFSRKKFWKYPSSSQHPGLIDAVRQRPQTIKRVVLELFKTYDEMVTREEELTMERDADGVPYWKRTDTYNLNKGGIYSFGSGADNPMHGNTHTQGVRQIISKANQGNKNALGHKKSAEAIEKSASAQRKKILLEYSGNRYVITGIQKNAGIFGARLSSWVTGKHNSWHHYGITDLRQWKESDGILPELAEQLEIIDEFKVITKELNERPPKIIRNAADRRPRWKSAVVFGFKSKEYRISTVADRAKFFNCSENTVFEWACGHQKVYRKYGMEFIRFQTEADRKDASILDAMLHTAVRDEIRANMEKVKEIGNKKAVVFEYAGKKLCLPSLTNAYSFFDEKVRGWLYGASNSWQRIDIGYIRFATDDDTGYEDAWKYGDLQQEIAFKIRSVLQPSTCPIEVTFVDGQTKAYENAVAAAKIIGCHKKVLLDRAKGHPKQKRRYGLESVRFIEKYDAEQAQSG